MIKQHQHIYNEAGVCEICSQTAKVYEQANARNRAKNSALKTASSQKHQHEEGHPHDHSEDDGHDHEHSLDGNSSLFKLFLPSIVSLLLLLLGLGFDNLWTMPWFNGNLRLAWYLAAYLPVGLPVLKDAVKSIKKGNFFSEFFLMGIATLGAFAIAEYPEGVAVMLFYAVGESFQTLAVSRAKSNIKKLLDQRPDEASIIRDGKTLTIKAKDVKIGDIIQLKPGEKLGLDGLLISDTASFNTAALTGESKPDTKNKGEQVLAGMINLQSLAQIEVTTAYADSKLSKILELVQNASAQKAATELFISKFARIYTPIVVFLAIAICFIPYFFVQDYVFKDWLYRSLIFLVVSCPCALVISIPLGYFGGIGAASRHGILVKGGNFLDVLAAVKHVVMDKTGTMTEGVFKVQELQLTNELALPNIMDYVNLLESKSTHPVATAIHEYVGALREELPLQDVEEIAGHGLKATINGKELLVGNFKLLDKYQVAYPVNPADIAYTTIAIAYDKQYQGFLTIADSIKPDAKASIEKLHSLGVKATMLSGDKEAVVRQVAKELGIDQAYGDLLPEDKVTRFKGIKVQDQIVAFVGDGVNDAPVVALSDVGIAMGGLGSDATIETADVVIQDDKPSKIPVAIQIGKKTKTIVWQNIGFAFGVKAIVLVLGAGGLATMWEAVFADVGVALLAILNAVRIQRSNFKN
ncbi:cadmium-translocating P-type ATPase [Sphingobacterium sp. DK4209]|uniref:P-type Zn(2+) transporter n=1 Tax=Sphingobacterium zhuxiongii TaxID=2662364 RepID=A0A5Q0QBN0_9SPHI|nr:MULTISPECIES: heavy metal translocating P-type ATPase [unclassified Sphingobacterium]MVZ67034.1 cadmium-translocating P-type ATPase [Sphingobacterium sp. DK4209]QGA26674.1 cadmium-translocating P-type ATPase [Sphingobacterium sp. dk4302]